MPCFFAESTKPARKMLVKLTSIGGVDILPKTLKTLSESINEDKHLWIACVSDKNFNKKDKNLSGFDTKIFTLRTNKQIFFVLISHIIRKHSIKT